MVEESEVEFGTEYRDKVTNYSGVCTVIAHHLTGCTRIGLTAEGSDPSFRNDTEYFYPSQLGECEEGIDINSDEFETDVNISLGEEVEETVTGFRGVVTTISFELYNVPRVAVSPVDTDDSTVKKERGWFDVPRVEVVGEGVEGEFNDVQNSNVESESGPSGSDLERKNPGPR